MLISMLDSYFYWMYVFYSPIAFYSSCPGLWATNDFRAVLEYRTDEVEGHKKRTEATGYTIMKTQASSFLLFEPWVLTSRYFLVS